MAISVSESSIKTDVNLSAEFSAAASISPVLAQPQLDQGMVSTMDSKDISAEAAPQELAFALPQLKSRPHPQCGGTTSRPCATIGIRG